MNGISRNHGHHGQIHGHHGGQPHSHHSGQQQQLPPDKLRRNYKLISDPMLDHSKEKVYRIEGINPYVNTPYDFVYK